MHICSTIGTLVPDEPAPREATAGFLSRLAERGHRVDLHTPDTEVAENDLHHELGDAEVHTYPAPLDVVWPAAGRLPPAFNDHAAQADVIYSVGVWDWPTVHAGWRAARTGTPHVIAPHEVLNPHARDIKPLRKALAWRLIHRRVIQHATAVHAMTPAEARYVADLTDTSVFVCRFGLDFPDPPADRTRQDEGPHLLFLGRIVPTKGLARAIAMLDALCQTHPDATLSIAGVGPSGHMEELRGEIRSRGLDDHVVWHGWVDGTAKWTLIRDADLLLVPSTFEGTSRAMLEALSQGTPVLRNEETRIEDADVVAGVVWLPPDAWGSKHGAETVEDALDRFEALSQKGRRFARDRLDWEACTDRFEAEIEKIVSAPDG